MCTGQGCNDPIQITIPTQVPGADGASAYVYIASADSNTGTNFTYPQDETQAYVAILSTTSPISTPVVGDFAGLWRKVNGTDGAPGTPGTNGTNGISSGIRYNFLNYGIASNPGTGNLSLSGSDLSTTSNIYIHETNLDSVDIEALLSAVGSTTTSSIKGFIKLTKQGDQTKFAVYSINSVTDSGAFQTLSVNYLSSTAVSTFVAGDDLLIEFYLTGDKGDKGDAGATGAFIVGTFGSLAGVEPYPTTATVGSAYRATQNGTISDSGANLLNVKRFYTNDVLYCIADTTSSDGTKWFLWSGFPRPFYPGAGTDSFIHNTATPGSAAGASAIAFNRASIASGLNSSAFSGGTSSGESSFAFQGVSSGKDSIAIGANSLASGAQSTALGNGAQAKALASLATGYFSETESGADASMNNAALGLIKSTGKYASTFGKSSRADFQGETVIGHGEYDNTYVGQSQTRIIPQVLATTNATPGVLGFLPGVAGSLTLPTKSVWSISGSIVAVATSNGNSATWFFKGLIKNNAGTAAIVDNILYLDPVTGTYITTSTQFAQDATAPDMSTTSLAITVSTSNLVLTVTGIAATNIRWSGTVHVEQITWI